MGWQPPNRPQVQGSPKAGELWEECTTAFTQRCGLISIWGPQSSGKSTLALTAKGPIALSSSSEKIEGIYQPFVRAGKVVRRHDYGFAAATKDEGSTKAEQLTANMARAKWAKFESAFYDAFDGWAASLIIDTEPDLWALRRYARFGTLNPKGDLRDLYTEINFQYMQLVKAKQRVQADTGKRNLILVGTCKDEYKDVVKQVPGRGAVKNSERTGNVLREGHKSIGFWSDVVLFTYREMEENSLEYCVRIDKGWFNGAVEGSILTSAVMEALGYSTNGHPHNSYLNLPAIMAYITGTPESEWL